MRKEKEVKQAQFMKNPYRFTKTLLEEARSGRFTSPKEVVEGFLKESHSDTFGSTELKLLRKSLTPVNKNGESRKMYIKLISICSRTKWYIL